MSESELVSVSESCGDAFAGRSIAAELSDDLLDRDFRNFDFEGT